MNACRHDHVEDVESATGDEVRCTMKGCGAVFANVDEWRRRASWLTGQRTITSEGRIVAQVRVVVLDEHERIPITRRDDSTVQVTARYRASVTGPGESSFVGVYGETAADALMRCADALLTDVRESRTMMAALRAFAEGEDEL